MPSTTSSVLSRWTGRRNNNNNIITNNSSQADLTPITSSSSVNVAAGGDAGDSDSPPRKLQSSSTWGSNAQQRQQHRRDSSILSLTTSNLTELGSNVKRSVSVRSHRTTPSNGSSLGAKTNVFTPMSSTSSPVDSPAESKVNSPQKEKEGTQLLRRKISLSARGLSHKFKSTEALPALNNQAYLDGIALRSPPDDPNHTGKKVSEMGSRPGLGIHTQSSFTRDASSSHGAPLSLAPSAPPSVGGPTNPNTIYTQIQETSAKRMATIDYLRRVHEGDIFYFSTMHYSQASLSSMPSLFPHKLGRRATSYFILGLSLPAVLDMNVNHALEYLKALSSLLAEFETYQTLSGYDASGNTLSKGRMGAMFKSGMGLGHRSAKGRRSSTTADLVGLDPRQGDHLGMPLATRSPSDATSPLELSSPINPTGHEFAFLLTPHIPFDPDFGTTFGTLCDTLIDTYGRVMELVGSPDACSPNIGAEFAKADKAIRKILVANVVRELEDTTRAHAKSEMAGLGKLVLGGLM